MTQIRRNFLAITVLLAAAYGCSSNSGSSENMDSGSKTASRGENGRDSEHEDGGGEHGRERGEHGEEHKDEGSD